MALDTEKVSLELHVLVKIELTGKTLYCSDEELDIDGQHYDGRLLALPLRVGFSSFWQPKQRQSSIRIILNNLDGQLTSDLSDYEWGNRQITLTVGDGTDIADYSTEFVGLIRFPNGVEWNERQVTVFAIDKRGKESLNLPRHSLIEGVSRSDGSVTSGSPLFISEDGLYGGKFESNDIHPGCLLKIASGPNAGTYVVQSQDTQKKLTMTSNFPSTESDISYRVGYPDCEDKSRGMALPEVYGDWYEDGDSDQYVPAYCIDVPSKLFRVCAREIYAFSKVVNTKDGSVLTPQNPDYTYATFELTSYDPDEDTIVCQPKGAVSGGTWLENPSDIAKDILQTYLGQEDADLDLTAFAAAKTKTRYAKCRRWIGSSVSTDTLIQELGNECNFDSYVANGKHTIKYREPILYAGSAPEYDKLDLVDGTFSVSQDPESIYTNDIHSRFRYDPSDDEWDASFRYYDSDAIESAQGTYSKAIDFQWLFEKDRGVEPQLQRWIFLLGFHPNTVNIRLKHRALLRSLGDEMLFSLADDFGNVIYAQSALQIREISKYWARGEVGIAAWDVLKFVNIGRWTEDGVATYDDSTSYERKAHGFWTDDNWRANPALAESMVSRYF